MGIKAAVGVVSALVAMSASMPASAAELTYTLTGSARAVWTIDTATLPSTAGSDSFTFQDVTGNYSALPGNGPVNYLADIQFFSTKMFGGLKISNYYDNIEGLVDAVGPQLYTGSTTAPALSTGIFELIGNNDPSLAYTLTVTEAVAAVPESATWGLMILGFAAAGTALRTRRTKVAFQTA